MNKLSELLRERMSVEKLSTRAVAKMVGVSHSTIARACNGETVEVETLVGIADFLGVPVESILDIKESSKEVMDQIAMVLSIEPELSSTFAKIARKITAGEMDKKVLSEIAAFAAYRLQISEQSEDTQKSKKLVHESVEQ